MTGGDRDNDSGVPIDGADSGQSPLESVLLTPGVIDAVRSLVEIMDRGGLSKLDLVHGDLSIRLRAGEREVLSSASALAASVDAESSSPAPVLTPVASADGATDDYVVTSPMVGTFYASPSPGAPAFVDLGDTVEAGQTVGIVEAMKIMNEIVAERGGFVTKILVGNGHAVEYGSPLIHLGATDRASM